MNQTGTSSTSTSTSPSTSSSTSPMRRLVAALLAAVLAVGIAATVAAAAGSSDEDRDRGPDRSEIAVDVAEDGTRFVFDENGPLLDNGLPDYGNGFVTQGYIYPAGTLNETNGVLADGSPEFPDQVIGRWTCYGYFIGDGADTTEGAWVVTSQVFEFDSDVESGQSIVTIGTETPAGAGPVLRSVVGGTGDLRSVNGQVEQVTLGHNGSEGVNATFAFDLQGARRLQGVLGS